MRNIKNQVLHFILASSFVFFLTLGVNLVVHLLFVKRWTAVAVLSNHAAVFGIIGLVFLVALCFQRVR